MSYEELEERDIFLPRRAWGELRLQSSVPTLAVAAMASGALAGCLLMWWGDGAALTWWGTGLFLACVGCFGWLSNVGIERQSRRIEALARPQSREANDSEDKEDS